MAAILIHGGSRTLLEQVGNETGVIMSSMISRARAHDSVSGGVVDDGPTRSTEVMYERGGAIVK